MVLKFETKNELIIGSVAGVLAAIPKYLFNELMQLLGLTKYDNNYTAFSVILNNYSHTTEKVFFAFLIAIIIGMFFGVILAFLFSKVFTSHLYLLKGTLYGIGIWLFNFGIAAHLFFKYPTGVREEIGIAISMLIGLMIYGFFTAYFLKRFGIFENKQSIR